LGVSSGLLSVIRKRENAGKKEVATRYASEIADARNIVYCLGGMAFGRGGKICLGLGWVVGCVLPCEKV